MGAGCVDWANAETEPASTTNSDRAMACLMFMSAHLHLDRFDDVAHEAAGIPVGFRGLLHAVAVDRLDHQRVLAFGLGRVPGMPAAETVFAVVLLQPRFFPVRATVARPQHL